MTNELALTTHERTQFMKSLAAIQNDRTLQRLNPAFRQLAQGVTPTLEISVEDFDAISDWYHYAILELTFTRGFSSDETWIARRLGISVSQAREAIERLIRLRLLERDSNGVLSKAHETITTAGHKITAPALRHYQRQILEKAVTSLDTVAIEQRCMHSITVPVTLPNIPLAKEMIREFARALCKTLENGEPTEVYQLGIALYPVSTLSKESETVGLKSKPKKTDQGRRSRPENRRKIKMKARKMTLTWMIAGLVLHASAFAAAGGSEASGVPNPASANCVKKGGKSNITDTQMGQIGVCSFGRAGISEWTLFRTQAPASLPMAVVAYLKHPAFSHGQESGRSQMISPATAYCGQVGGQPIIVSDYRTKNQYGLCEFQDRSSIEEWTLLYGSSAPQNQQLNQALGLK
jgi:uncharacterized protein (TIGR02147 family)